MRAIRHILWGLVAVFVLAMATVFLMQKGKDGFERLKNEGEQALILGQDFNLTNHRGEPISQDYFKDYPSVLFFGFTYCPDICPTTLNDLSLWHEQLAPKLRKNMRYGFITVDPERDTPAAMAAYIESFPVPVMGITGEPEDIKALADSWRVFAQKVPLGEGEYTVNHTASLFLVNPDGSLKGTITYQEKPEVAFSKLELLAKTRL